MQPEARGKPQYPSGLVATLSGLPKSANVQPERGVPSATHSAANDEAPPAAAADQNVDLSAVLDRIAVLSDEELQAEWLIWTDGTAPQVPDDLLRLMLAYHVQQERLGRLDEAAANGLDLTGRHDGSYSGVRVPVSQPTPQSRTRKSRTAAAQPSLATPSVGTRLIREWNGQTIRVDVREEGLVWNGKVYASLSAVARAVTGARWSGPRFFGITGNG